MLVLQYGAYSNGNGIAEPNVVLRNYSRCELN